jgi:hypothetical protein
MSETEIHVTPFREIPPDGPRGLGLENTMGV